MRKLLISPLLLLVVLGFGEDKYTIDNIKNKTLEELYHNKNIWIYVSDVYEAYEKVYDYKIQELEKEEFKTCKKNFNQMKAANPYLEDIKRPLHDWINIFLAWVFTVNYQELLLSGKQREKNCIILDNNIDALFVKSLKDAYHKYI